MGEWQINDFIPDPNTGKDRWQIHKIFKGGMGVVYIVYDTKWREAFAVKTYQDKLQSKEAQEQFKKEANIWINLDRNENIVWARFIENIHDRLYLFLEYVPGGDLSRWICTKRLDLKQTLLFAIQFCYGMEHALSKGMKAHLDIKPKNCLITAEGTLKITDFGLAKSLALQNNILAPAGTPEYMPPEQWDDFTIVDVKADIYSFGAMLYEMIIGEPPFGKRPDISNNELKKRHKQNIIPQVPSSYHQLNKIIHKCMAKESSKRYADFAHLLKDLVNLYENLYKEKAPVPKENIKMEVNDLLNKGGALYVLGHSKEAIIYYDKVIEIDPQFNLAWFNKGSALVELERYEEALISYDRALEHNSKSAEVLYCKGATLEKLGRYDEALSYINQALHINSKHIKALYNKGVVFGILEKYDEAITCYDQVLKIDPQFIDAWYNKGLAFINLKQNEEALICFNKVLKIDIEHAHAWHNKGVVFGEMGQLLEPLKCFQNAYRLGYSQAAEAIEKCQMLLDKQ